MVPHRHGSDGKTVGVRGCDLCSFRASEVIAKTRTGRLLSPIDAAPIAREAPTSVCVARLRYANEHRECLLSGTLRKSHLSAPQGR